MSDQLTDNRQPTNRDAILKLRAETKKAAKRIREGDTSFVKAEVLKLYRRFIHAHPRLDTSDAALATTLYDYAISKEQTS